MYDETGATDHENSKSPNHRRGGPTDQVAVKSGLQNAAVELAGRVVPNLTR